MNESLYYTWNELFYSLVSDLLKLSGGAYELVGRFDFFLEALGFVRIFRRQHRQITSELFFVLSSLLLFFYMNIFL